MKRIYLFAITIAGALFLSACSSQFHPVINQNLLQTQVVLSQKNYIVIGSVEGSNEVERILGIGGISKKAMQDNAIADMFKNAKLTSSQAIVNISFKSAVSGVPPFYTTNVCTATGTIIEFTE
ncbi:MAG: hypothetical protein IJO17_02460 [Alistipes sp.]|nr:hypothetical protein [Alistipes sp.]